MKHKKKVGISPRPKFVCVSDMQMVSSMDEARWHAICQSLSALWLAAAAIMSGRNFCNTGIHKLSLTAHSAWLLGFAGSCHFFLRGTTAISSCKIPRFKETRKGQCPGRMESRKIWMSETSSKPRLLARIWSILVRYGPGSKDSHPFLEKVASRSRPCTDWICAYASNQVQETMACATAEICSGSSWKSPTTKQG